MSDCYTCRHNDLADRGAAPPRENVAGDEHWRVVHAFDSSLPGWLVLLPRRHVVSIAALAPAEAAGLGTWLHRLSVALREETGCDKTYVMQFAEAEGFAHLHFHVVPRAADLPADRMGPRIFGYLGADEADRLPERARDDLARRLGARLARTAASRG